MYNETKIVSNSLAKLAVLFYKRTLLQFLIVLKCMVHIVRRGSHSTKYTIVAAIFNLDFQ